MMFLKSDKKSFDIYVILKETIQIEGKYKIIFLHIKMYRRLLIEKFF